ncbi:hypothetical protein GGR54DRAFT_141823 [Hypoxylon sp. NC1633]|nr:hypothetical protein GGR54DRAFT_141823 [Hypoxylon sp. NC1633]
MPNFEFVNVNNPGDVKQHSTKIRRHVMKDIGKARRKPRANRTGQVILGARAGDEAEGSGSAQALACPNPMRDRTLHTTSYPVEIDERRLDLLRFMVDEARYTYRPFRFPWLSMGLSDEAAWHITMANATLFREGGPGSKKTEFSVSTEAMKWYTMSLTSTAKRLADPNESGSEGLIIAITGFVCHDTSVGNFDRFGIHMDGLQRMIEKRGGLDTLSSPFLRMMICWYDLIEATYFNTSPRFGVLEDSIAGFDTGDDAEYLEHLLESWDGNCPALGDIMSALKATAAVASYINRRADEAEFWTDDVTAARLLSPAFHEILSLEGRPLPNDTSDPQYAGTAAREAFRRAALVFLAAIKMRMGAGAYEMDRHLDAFRQISQLPLVDWGVVPELNLWAHVISAMQEESPNRAWHVLTIVSIMDTMGLESSRQAIDTARGIIWVDAIDEGKSEKLCHEIHAYIEARKSPQQEAELVDP